jgi:hypothetical protein
MHSVNIGARINHNDSFRMSLRALEISASYTTEELKLLQFKTIEPAASGSAFACKFDIEVENDRKVRLERSLYKRLQ